MSKLDMPPNAQSVGGGKKKKKEKNNGENQAQAAVLPVVAAPVEAPQPAPASTSNQQVAAPEPVAPPRHNNTQTVQPKSKAKNKGKKLEKENENTVTKDRESEVVDSSSENDRISQNSQSLKEEETCSEIVEKECRMVEEVLVTSEEKIDEDLPEKCTQQPVGSPPKKGQQSGKIAPNKLQSPMSKTPSKKGLEAITPRSRQASLSYNKGQVVPHVEPPTNSIVGAVTDFVSDVIPRSSSQIVHPLLIEKADWVQLGTIEQNGNPKERRDILVIGLIRGFQIWALGENGEFEEVLSERQGPIRACKVLPNNFNTRNERDPFAEQRPLIATVDTCSHVPDRQYCSVQIISLATGKDVHRLVFDEPVCAINTSNQYMAISLTNRVFVYDILTFSEIRNVRTAYPCENCPPSVAISGQMLAFADAELNYKIQSAGGMAAEVTPSNNDNYADQMRGAFGMLSRTVKSISGSVGGTAAGNSSKPNSPQGIVTVVSLAGAAEEPYDAVMCHFVAHVDNISYMTISPDQRLIVTSDSSATAFNVFLLMPHPVSPSLAAVQHLYKLNRGNTPAKVTSSSFSIDNRWFAVSTNHGTCHVFGICPFGGKPSQRTHGGPFVNKESRFHRSAGISDDADVRASIGPSKQRAMCGSQSFTKEHPVLKTNKALAKCSGNSRIGPFPPALSLSSIKKINDQRYSAENLTAWASDMTNLPLSGSSNANTAAAVARRRLDVSRLSMQFSARYQNSVNSPNMSLLIATADPTEGAVVCEYELRPKKKESEKSSVEEMPRLSANAVALWNLQRTKNNADLHLPMPLGSPLMNMASLSTQLDPKKPGEEMWTPHVETRTFQAPHRWIWQGPQFEFYEYKEEDSAVLMSPYENRGSSNCFKSIPVVVGGGSVQIASENVIPSDATRIECGSYTSTHSFSTYSNFDTQADITSKIADAMREITTFSPTPCSQPNDIDAPEEFFDTQSTSLDRRGSSTSSSTKSKKIPPTCAPLPKTTEPIDDEDDDLVDFEMEDM